jgi:hypothetical protein
MNNSLDISRQPVKGIFFTAISVPAAVGIWFLVHGAFGLDYASSSLVITVCFSWFWQLAWSFGGWPANRVTENRWARGSINWLLLMSMVLLTIAVWHWYYKEPFQDTNIGLWGSTAIVAGVISLFFFGNTLLLPAELADRQPLGGFVNLLWGLFLLPLGLLLLPTLGGNGALYIPWIWFPITLVVMGYFGGHPFDQLGQPRAGIAYMGAVFAGTVAFLAILHIAGTDFFAGGTAAEKAAVFGATWTNVGFVYAWLFNQYPFGDLPQPLKGIVGTAGTLAVTAVIYAVVVGSFAASELTAVVFGEFALMWAIVSFAGVGLFNAFEWGYEEDPGGAGIGLGERLERPESTSAPVDGRTAIPTSN